MSQIIGQFAGLLALLSVIPYFVSIFKNRTKPSRTAYAIWTVIDTVTAASYIASGARATAYIAVVYAFCSLAIFLLSVKYGMGGLNKFDLWCLGLSTIAIAIWISTGNPIIALYASLLAGKLGYLPVIKKSYLYPSTESTLSWAMSASASILNIFAITSWRLEISLLPISSAIVQSVIVILLIRPSKPVSKIQGNHLNDKVTVV